ncbi:MAG: hypothetical protein JWO93_730 [Micrococcaceae bacterium]|nr:hypothetical protein [Micrococcaceae bacterium]
MFGPFTLRDLVLLGSVLVMFIGSLLPIVQVSYTLNLWTGAALYFIGIGIVLPLAVGVLHALRRLAPEARIRIGSLSIDQFASVVAAFAAAYFFLSTVSDFSIGFLISLIGALGLLAATVAAPLVPAFAPDFTGRREVPAHPVAREAVPAAKGVARSTSKGAPAGGSEPKKAKFTLPRPGASKSAGTGTSNAASPASSGSTAAGSTAAGSAAGGAATAASGPAASASSASTSTAAGAPTRASADASGTVNAAGATTANPVVGNGATASPVTAATTANPTVGNGATASPATTATTANPTVGNTATAGPATTAATANPTTVNPAVVVRPESIGATVDPADRSGIHEHGREHEGSGQHYEAFWFAVDRPRPVVDERSGAYLFTVEPGNWILALQDRGNDYVVQHTDGRVGVLRDLSNIERAPEGD